MRTAILGICLLLVVGCTSPTGTCSPSRAATEREVQLATDDDFEAWSLWFLTDKLFVAGQPIALSVGEEVKVVWSVTGEGEFSVAVEDGKGVSAQPVFGPQPHGGSTWDAPGAEWGTAWSLPSPGCWRFTVRRGTDTAILVIEAIT